MRKIGRISLKRLARKLRKIDYNFILMCLAWSMMGFYLFCKFWRFI